MSLADLNDGHLAGFGLVLMGLFLFLIGYLSRRRKIGRFVSGVRTSAKALSVLRFRMEGSTFYRFALEFEGPAGHPVAAKTDVGRRTLVKIGGFDDLIVGSSLGEDMPLPVVYDPDHPKRVDIEAVLSLMRPERGALALGWFWWVVVLLVGAGLVFRAIVGGDPICLCPDIGRQCFCDGFGR
jgi:hypothetical protein